jgi:hypothetical protein
LIAGAPEKMGGGEVKFVHQRTEPICSIGAEWHTLPGPQQDPQLQTLLKGDHAWATFSNAATSVTCSTVGWQHAFRHTPDT